MTSLTSIRGKKGQVDRVERSCLSNSSTAVNTMREFSLQFLSLFLWRGYSFHLLFLPIALALRPSCVVRMLRIRIVSTITVRRLVLSPLQPSLPLPAQSICSLHGILSTNRSFVRVMSLCACVCCFSSRESFLQLCSCCADRTRPFHHLSFSFTVQFHSFLTRFLSSIYTLDVLVGPSNQNLSLQVDSGSADLVSTLLFFAKYTRVS